MQSQSYGNELGWGSGSPHTLLEPLVQLVMDENAKQPGKKADAYLFVWSDALWTRHRRHPSQTTYIIQNLKNQTVFFSIRHETENASVLKYSRTKIFTNTIACRYHAAVCNGQCVRLRLRNVFFFFQSHSKLNGSGVKEYNEKYY